MFKWMPYPFVRIVVFFIAGVLLGVYQPDIVNERLVQILLGVFVLLYIILFFVQQKWKESA